MDSPDTPPRPTQLAHTLLREVIRPGDCVADATAGNGHDTVFLAECVGPDGKVLAFDVQPAAISACRKKLRAAGLLNRVELFQVSHSQLHEHADAGSLAAVMFNLGYLPGEDHRFTTTAGETLTALEAAASSLKPEGLLTVVCYPGHAEGLEEAREVEAWMAALPGTGWRVAKYGMLGTLRPSPFLLCARRP